MDLHDLHEDSRIKMFLCNFRWVLRADHLIIKTFCIFLWTFCLKFLIRISFENLKLKDSKGTSTNRELVTLRCCLSQWVAYVSGTERSKSWSSSCGRKDGQAQPFFGMHGKWLMMVVITSEMQAIAMICNDFDMYIDVYSIYDMKIYEVLFMS